MTNPLRLMLSLALMAMPLASASAAQFCGELVEGGAVLRKTEAEARKDAENWWASRAGSLGPGFQDWSLAKDKALTCSEKTDGSFRCVAKARPCLPEGEVPPQAPRQEM